MHAGRAKVRWLYQEDLSAGLLSGPHCLCLRAPAWSNSDSGQQLPCGLKVPFTCPQLAAWLLTSSVWTMQGLIHGHTTHTQKDAHSIQFPAIAMLKFFLLFDREFFGHLMRRVDSLEKTLMLGGTGGRRRRGWQRMRWLDGITDLMDVSLSNSRIWWWTGRPGVLWFMGLQRVGHDWATELNWIEAEDIRRGGKNTQENYTKKIFMTQKTMMVW